MPEPIEHLPGELWKPVVGYEARYRVSNKGRVACQGGVMRLTLNIRAYHVLTLWDGRRGRTKRVQRLVLEAFVGPCPPGMEACHNDGTRTNNHVENLRWASPMDNAADRRRHGTQCVGSLIGVAKLTAAAVLDIRRARVEGRLLGEIADEWGVDESTIYQVVHRKTWRHV